MMALVSQTLRSMHLALNQTLERAWQLRDQPRWVIGRNLPAFHGWIVFLILLCRASPLVFLVFVQVAIRVTPIISRWSESVMYLQGMSSCLRVVRQLPHFLLRGSLWSLQPEALSKRARDESTTLNSAFDVIAGLLSSAYPINLYLCSSLGSAGMPWRTGPWTGAADIRIPCSTLSSLWMRGSIPKQNSSMLGTSPCLRVNLAF